MLYELPALVTAVSNSSLNHTILFREYINNVKNWAKYRMLHRQTANTVAQEITDKCRS